MEEKSRSETGACGKASVLLAGALKNNHVIAIAVLLAAAAAIHFAGDLFQTAFAEQSEISQVQLSSGNSYHRSVSESLSVVASHGGGSASAPMSYQRYVSESMAVTSTHGKAPASYSRSMSEQASLTTGMPSSAPAAAQLRAAPAPTPYSASSNQRIDERISLRNLAGSSTAASYKSVAGTSVYSDDSSMIGTQLSGSGADILIFDTASVEAGESDSDGSSIRYLLTEMGAAKHHANFTNTTNLVFGVQGLAVVAVALVKSSTIVSTGRKLTKVSTFRAFLATFSSPSEKLSTQSRVIVVLFAFVSVTSAASLVVPLFGQVAADTNDAYSAYQSNTGTNTLTSPKYREWDGATETWGNEVELDVAESGNNLKSVKIYSDPTTPRRIILTDTVGNDLVAYVCESSCTTPSSWTKLTVTTSLFDSDTTSYRPWDGAFETTSGDFLIVYDKSLTETNDLYYQIIAAGGTTLSGETGFTNDATNNDAEEIRFVVMDSHPTTDEIAIIHLDATLQDAIAHIWSGSAIGNQKTISSAMGTTSITGEAIGIKYYGDGSAQAFSGNGANSAAWCRWASSAWCTTPTTADPDSTNNNDVKWVDMKTNPADNTEMMVCESNDLNDLNCSNFDAGTAGTWHDLDSTLDSNAASPAAFAYYPGSQDGRVYYGTTNGAVTYNDWTDGSQTFGSANTFTSAGSHTWMRASRNPTAADTVDHLVSFYNDASPFNLGTAKNEAGTMTNIGDTSLSSDTETDTTHQAWDLAWQFVAEPSVFTADLTESMTMTETVSTAITRTVTEQAAMTEQVARTLMLPKSASEQLSVADTMDVSVNKPLSESLVMTDTIARSVVQSRSVAEQMTIQETASAVMTKVLAEQLVTTDAAARTLIASRSMTEQMVMQATVTVENSRSIAEQMGVMDSVQRSTVISRSMSEAMVVTDMPTTAFSKTMTEQVTVTEQIDAGVTLSRSASEQLGVTDALVISVDKSLSEQVALADIIARSMTQSRSMTEQLAMQETARAAIAKVISEQLEMTDVIERELTSSRTVSEQLAIAEDTSTVHSRSVLEQLAISDDLQRSITSTRTLAEQMGVADIVTNAVTKPMSESLAVSDSIAKTVIQTGLLFDELTMIDALDISTGKPLSDELAATETVARSLTLSRSITEQIGMTDAISAVSAKVMAEQLVVTDSLTKNAVISRTMTEQMAMTDATAKATFGMMIEQLDIADNLQRSIDAARAHTEQLAVADATAKSVSMTVSEQLAIAESAARISTQLANASEQMSASESVSIAISKSMLEQLAVAESPRQSGDISRGMTEQAGIADAVEAAVSKDATEQLALQDAAARSITASRSMIEQLRMTDAAGTITAISIPDQLAMADSVSISVAIGLAEQISASDSTAATSLGEAFVTEQLVFAESIDTTIAMSKSAPEQLVVADSISISVSISIADQLAMSDSVIEVSSGGAFAAEQLTVVESITKTTSKSSSDSLAVTESIAISISVQVAEQLAMSDLIVVASGGEAVLAEQLGMIESMAIVVSKSVSDGLTLSDAVIISGSTGTTESIAVTDAVARSVIIARTVSESLAMTDTVNGAPSTTVMITDSITISDAFSEISVVFNMNLPESLVMAQGFATNFEGFFDQAGSEGIVIGDSVALAIDSIMLLSEIMALQDQIIADQANGRTISESMLARDAIAMLVTRSPPPPPAAIAAMPSLKMAMTNNVGGIGSLTDPAQAVGVSGTWNIESLNEEGLEALLGAIGMPVYDISMATSSSDIGDMTIAMPIFWVSMEGDLSDAGGFLTPTISDLPAGMQVMVPINIGASMEGDENLDLLGNMTLTFTPAADAEDFTMLITILNNNPEDISEETPGDVSAFYLDVTIAGDFAGATPDDEAFFEESPVITFTVTEEWAEEQDLERDSNDVPIISLYLLDEGTGDWIEIVDIESPVSATGDVYVYAATLPHFSTFAVTAETASSGGGSGGGSGGSGSSGGGSGPATITRSLIESLTVDSIMQPYSAGEELVRELAESITFRDSQDPQHHRIITIQNVTVTVRVVDVRSAAFGTAAATLNFEITNKNGATEELVLRYFYSDPTTGQRIYENEQTIMVDAGGSAVYVVEIPFSSDGVYDVMIEAGTDDGTIVSTDIVIDVPWLEVYVYVLAVVIIGIVTAPIVFVAYAVRQSLIPLAAGDRPGGTVLTVILRLLRTAVTASVFITHVLQRAGSAADRRPVGAIQYPTSSTARHMITALYAATKAAGVVGRSIIINLTRESARAFGLVVRSLLEEKNWAAVGQQLSVIAVTAAESMTRIGRVLRHGATRYSGDDAKRLAIALYSIAGAVAATGRNFVFSMIQTLKQVNAGTGRMSSGAIQYPSGGIIQRLTHALDRAFKFIFRRQA